jgi:hypothetical protein
LKRRRLTNDVKVGMIRISRRGNTEDGAVNVTEDDLARLFATAVLENANEFFSHHSPDGFQKDSSSNSSSAQSSPSNQQQQQNSNNYKSNVASAFSAIVPTLSSSSSPPQQQQNNKSSSVSLNPKIKNRLIHLFL